MPVTQVVRRGPFLERSRVVQILESQVSAKITSSAATASAARENYRINGFRFDAGVFDSAHRRL